MGNPRVVGQAEFVELYDLQQDPQEIHNLAADPQFEPIRKDLDQQLRKWLEDMYDPILRGPEPSPFYSASMEDFLGTQSDRSNHS
jgi:arylsulfatase A-like enzyme